MFHPSRLLALVLTLSCGFAYAQEDSDAPIVTISKPRIAALRIPDRAPAEEDYARRHSAWVQRVWVAPFEDRIKGTAWESDARSFVSEAIPIWWKRSGSPLVESLPAKARELIDRGCDDPLVLFLAAVVHIGRDRDQLRREAYNERAMRQITKIGVDANRPLAWFIAAAVRKARVAAKKEVDDLDAQMNAWSRAMIEDGTYAESEADIYVRHQTEGESAAFIEKNGAKLIPFYRESKLPEWARETLAGACEIGVAWSIRGNGWGRTVKGDAWGGFEEHIAGARTALVKAWELRPDVPVAPTRMIAVTMAEFDQEEQRLWFERVVEHHPEYEDAYDDLLYALLPRWGGSHYLVLQFGEACMATERYDTIIPQMYFRACNKLFPDLADWQGFFRKREVAEPYLLLSRKLLEHSSTAEERHMRLSYLAVNAWITGNFAAAADSLAKLKDPLNPEAREKLEMFGTDEDDFRAEVEVFGGPARADFVQADLHADRGEMDLARELYAKASAECGDLGRSLIAGRLTALDVEESLESGEWVPLTGQPQLGAWTNGHGHWRGGNNGAIVIGGDGKRSLLVHRAAVGPHFELRGTFTIDDPQRNRPNFTVAWGWHPDDIGRYCSAGIHQGNGATEPLANVWNRERKSVGKGASVSLKPVNEFHLRVHHGAVTYELNGERIFENLKSPMIDEGPELGRVGLSAIWFGRGTTTRIARLEVRRLEP